MGSAVELRPLGDSHRLPVRESTERRDWQKLQAAIPGSIGPGASWTSDPQEGTWAHNGLHAVGSRDTGAHHTEAVAGSVRPSEAP